MGRPSKAEEAILLASENAAAADYLVKRGEAENDRLWDSISEETEAELLKRNDRLINLRLAEYCLYPATARALFHHDPTDWAVRSLVLSNQKIAKGLILNSFPECLFGSVEALKAYLSSITPDDANVLFANPAIDDRFLDEVLELGDYWQEMPERARLVALSSLADNPKLQKPVHAADHAEGWGWYMAGQPFNAAWRLVISLDVNADIARHLSHLYDRLAPYCLEREGILDALPKWMPQNEPEREEEFRDNEGGNLSSYQTIRRAAAAMLLQRHEHGQEKLLASGDSAIRCGAYLVGRFTPEEMKSAIERDGWLATASLMQNPNCWRTSEHRDALKDGVSVAENETFANASRTVYREYDHWEYKFINEHPEWFELEEAGLEPADKPLTESSTGDLIRQVVTSRAFMSLNGKVEKLAQARRVNFWLLLMIIAILIFRG